MTDEAKSLSAIAVVGLASIPALVVGGALFGYMSLAGGKSTQYTPANDPMVADGTTEPAAEGFKFDITKSDIFAASEELMLDEFMTGDTGLFSRGLCNDNGQLKMVGDVSTEDKDSLDYSSLLQVTLQPGGTVSIEIKPKKGSRSYLDSSKWASEPQSMKAAVVGELTYLQDCRGYTMFDPETNLYPVTTINGVASASELLTVN